MGMNAAMVFLRGFMVPPAAYDKLLAPVRALGVSVIVPKLYGISALTGRFTAADEAAAAMSLVRNGMFGLDSARPVWWVGHSRGGQAAWLIARHLWGSSGASGTLPPPAGLIVIDPVDGAGPRPRHRNATREPVTFPKKPLVVGCGRSGACAPAAVGYRAFADACRAAEVVVLPEAGHADVLGGRWLGRARRLCPGADDPTAVRTAVSRLLIAHITAAD